MAIDGHLSLIPNSTTVSGTCYPFSVSPMALHIIPSQQAQLKLAGTDDSERFVMRLYSQEPLTTSCKNWSLLCTQICRAETRYELSYLRQKGSNILTNDSLRDETTKTALEHGPIKNQNKRMKEFHGWGQAGSDVDLGRREGSSHD